MASFKNDFGLNGKLGDVIIYQIPEVERDFVKENIEGVCSRKQFQWLYVLS